MTESNAEVRERLYELESQRQAAIQAGDRDALALLLSDDFQQVHAHGLIEDKAAVLASAAAYPGTADPNRPEITVYGDVALIKGVSIRRVLVEGMEREFRIFATRVAARENDDWRYIHIQATMIPEAKD